MGLVAARIEMMLKARAEDRINFGNTLTLGRQKIWLSKKQFTRLEKKYGITGIDDGSISFHQRVYADNFLRENFDIEHLSVLDYSGYENADIVHDMNQPIPQEHEQKYDVVIDGGTLEHIFNFPLAISNCMNMLKENGHMFIFTMANNHLGHGLYQFSPELFFRIFEANNGFTVKSIVLVEHPFPGAELSTRSKCFSVQDPARSGVRGSLLSNSPMGMMIYAQKNRHKNLFSLPPLQSDYQSSWHNMIRKNDSAQQQSKNELSLTRISTLLRSALPFRVENYLTGLKQLRSYSFRRNRNSLKKWPEV